MRLLLVRHGESLGNVTKALQGRDDPLTDRGRRQARMIAGHLAGRGDVQWIYASPLARAHETSRIIAAAIGVEPELRENLAEINVGHAAGLTFEEWARQNPEAAACFNEEGADFVFPAGESGRQLGARIAVEIDRIIFDHGESDDVVAVVSHGGALAWILSHLLREQRDGWPPYEFDNCSVTEVAIENGTISIVYRNEIAHLESELEEEVVTGRL